ncbi:mitogen-activated protein kinase kinase 3 isoform X1 [Selaginella moellendorffii]|uniref:mitogen-activated protein kinase kinase 3 isoform X1 n=1 Tax=Selaginella moellendorffii TaxID=88036 RepID=UPI000D1CBB31|nr:mitogen-activated protein kinase kinase 3 isoform X1 [Selaginella moellendorffii]|eukprot:XP_024530529.1 mitogen-activated protein kinase kinase 3 isoform X1 [Selaginella moellendorffii]
MDQMKKKLMPLINMRPDMSIDASASYKVTDGGTLNLLSRSCGEYNINQLGLQKKSSAGGDDKDDKERTYQCASNEMCVFGAIGWGASSVVRKAIHIPTHRILALKKINVFEKEKRQQLLNEIRTLCEAPMAKGLVEFYGAFYSPDSGQISIALEYMDGGSLADIVRNKKFIPEPILSVITRKVLQGLQFLHGVRHLVHRDIKPANLLINLIGEPKITDFGISAGLDNSIAMCATFVGTVTYMSPERINNECYSYPADIWSLGLALLECGTGEFPYNASKGPVNLMLQVMYDPSPAPPADRFSCEFRSFVEACLRKDADTRPTAEQLLQHPFIKKYENADVDLAGFVHSVFDPTERLKDLSDVRCFVFSLPLDLLIIETLQMLTVHYYMLFDGPDSLWHHMKTFYRQNSTFSFANQTVCGLDQVFTTLTDIRNMLAGERAEERLVHVVENLQCCAYSKRGIVIRVSGAFVLGSHFIPTSDGIQVEGLLASPSLDVQSRQMGTFSEQFVMEPAEQQGSFFISKQELYIQQ